MDFLLDFLHLIDFLHFDLYRECKSAVEATLNVNRCAPAASKFSTIDMQIKDAKTTHKRYS